MDVERYNQLNVAELLQFGQDAKDINRIIYPMANGHYARVLVRNKRGIHARAGTLIVQEVSRYSCETRYSYVTPHNTRGHNVDLRNFLGLLVTGSSFGTRGVIATTGEQSEECLKGLVKLFFSKFDEE